jgi:adenylosuccinate synthase
MTAPAFPLWGTSLPAAESGSVDVAVGIQWGDEGKGRVVDRAAADYDIVARFGGGNNAGHTIVVGDRTVALRVVPSGALVPSTKLFIGGGTVVSLGGLVEELDALAAIGVDIGRVAISNRAHVVFPYHAALDRLSEAARGSAAIGTTGRGIGPAYIDKAARLGITFGDLARPEALAQKIRTALLTRRPQFGTAEVPSEEAVIGETLAYAKRLAPHITDGVAYIHDALGRGARILAEGAQGTLLDVGFGSYPYVTSSHTIAGGACIGLGIGPRTIRRVTGIAKAYCTRVGGGPFPSELHDELGERLRARGGEFGVVTGRPRRCGWFDAVAARYAAQLNGLTDCVVTKLDVLTGFEKIGIVTGYRTKSGAAVGVEAMSDPETTCEITWHDGWTEDISTARTRDELPAACIAYVAALEAALGVPLAFVSVGPERTALIR